MIYLEKYTKQNVFADAYLNVFFNQLITLLSNVFDADYVIQNLVPDGMIALALQNEPANIRFTRLELITSKIDLFLRLKASAKMLDIISYEIVNQELILKLQSGILVFIKYSNYPITTVLIREIYVRDKSEIK